MLDTTTAKGPIGLIGVGLLGTALAERLLGHGFRLVGTDVSVARREALERRGGEVVDTAAEVVRRCARIVLSVPSSLEVAEILHQADGVLRSGQVIVDTTTGDPERIVAAAAGLAARGVSYLDATVSGSSEQARRGAVVVMAGGDERAFAACADLFAAFARSVFHVGPCGAGTRMKLATNLVLGLNRAALAEGLAFAKVAGLDPALTLHVLREGAAYSRAMDTKGPKMLTGDFAPEARLSQHLKDVRLIVAEAARLGAKVPLSDVHRILLEAAETAGYGEADNSAILRAYEPADS